MNRLSSNFEHMYKRFDIISEILLSFYKRQDFFLILMVFYVRLERCEEGEPIGGVVIKSLVHTDVAKPRYDSTVGVVLDQLVSVKTCLSLVFCFLDPPKN